MDSKTVVADLYVVVLRMDRVVCTMGMGSLKVVCHCDRTDAFVGVGGLACNFE